MTTSQAKPPEDPSSLRQGWSETPDPSRFNTSHPSYVESMNAHQAAVAKGQDGYIDPQSGLFVMTAHGLRIRGYCCQRGCRHCPYIGASAGDDEPIGDAT